MQDNKIQAQGKYQDTRPIDPNVLQRSAANPEESIWVGASAGSGKTKVLVDRIIRLLLPKKNGVPGTLPYKILALTFTKAAASEMRIRIQETLGEWAIMPIEKIADQKKYLRKELSNLLGQDPTKEQLDSARHLFNDVIDTPGGINIMTIHSFCQSVLGRFPLEAGIKPNFKALEEAEARKFIEKSKSQLLKRSSVEAGSLLHLSVNHFTNLLNDDQFLQLLNTIIAERKQLYDIFKEQFVNDTFYNAICEELGINAAQNGDDLINNFCDLTKERINNLYHLIQALSDSSNKNDQARGFRIKNWLELSQQEKIKNISDYFDVFLTTKDTIRATIATKAVITENPDIENIITDESEKIFKIKEDIKTYQIAENTNYFLVLSYQFLEIYKSEKEKHNALDYDDLILHTNNLLQGSTNALKKLENSAAWIRYKMDQGIDHILVDEAQDTNPEQWEIIRSLTDDFFSHYDEETTRTLFVVGDEKQSIYSFQRASPKKFDEMRNFFKSKTHSSASRFQEVDFITSFRSAPAILSFIDYVYAQEKHRKGVGEKTIEHQSFRRGQPGQVTLWPLLSNDEKLEIDPWEPPTQIINYSSGASKMADYAGEQIKDWLDNERWLYSYNRAVEPGDILILLRSRNNFLNQLVRALKIRNIPVSGVDRLVLADHIAVQDLMAAAQFVLLPEDDLNLACLLKSPFIGLNEEQLFDLSYDRKNSLWHNIQDKNETYASWLQSLINQSKTQNPYEFFCSLLHLSCPSDEISGYRALEKRLGDEIIDPLEEFMNLALSASKDSDVSIQSFVQDQQSNTKQIKREMEEGNNKVRIMTVHGAKGLQAPIVILPDTTRNASSVKTDRIAWPKDTNKIFPYYAASTGDTPKICKDLFQNIKEKDNEEYRRLFYVAATRAESELYIGGYKGSKNIIEDSWYEYTKNTFENIPDLISKTCTITEQEIFTHLNVKTDKPDYTDKKHSKNNYQNIELPSWAYTKVNDTKNDTIEIYRPSDDIKEELILSPFSGRNDHRFKRGNIIHALLQILPDLPEDQREENAQTYLNRPIHKLDNKEQNEIFEEVFKLLNNNQFKGIFSPQAQAEVAITGQIGHKFISGKVDRLLITKDTVLIIDFKTNRPPPKDKKDVPQAYINQMYSYEAVLRGIYPNHQFKKALLWTNDAHLMEL